MTKTLLCRSDNLLPTEKRTLVSSSLCRTSKSKWSVRIFDIYTQPFITGIVKERFNTCQVGEYTFEITINGVNMVENKRRTTQSEYVKKLSRTSENSKFFLHSP